MSHLFCFGMGYSASLLARRLAARGWRISGTSTTETGADAIARAGWHGLLFDGAARSPAVSAALAEATHAVVSAPPGPAGDPALAHHADDLARSSALGWIGYLSTLGVYGDHGGRWIDETTPLAPDLPRTRRRVEAESAWLAFSRESGKRVQVFRLAGIYGPGRSAVDNVRDGTARRIVKPGQVFNRIHVEDIAAVLAAAIERGGTHEVYNVTDDEPAPPQDVIAYAAELLGAPLPPAIPFENAALSEMARSFYADNRRASNARMKSDLGVTLAYPTYREGLRAIAQSGT
jgi:nucleoside-diphosphate-sugar epimerase